MSIYGKELESNNMSLRESFVDLPLSRFTIEEIDILTAISYKYQNDSSFKTAREIVLGVEEVKNFASCSSEEDLDAFLRTFNRKLLEMSFSEGTLRKWRQFGMFSEVEVDLDANYIKVVITDKFSGFLKGLDYSSLELQESVQLKSSYSKALYNKLRKLRDCAEPKWIVSLEDFKEYFEVPRSYKSGEIDKKILKPAISELSAFFTNLQVDKYFSENSKNNKNKDDDAKEEGLDDSDIEEASEPEEAKVKKVYKRGRPSLEGYIFSFDKI